MEGGFNNSKPKSPERTSLLETLHLSAGKNIKLVKVHIFSSSNVPVGTEIEGTLSRAVRIGEPISFDHGAQISKILGVGVQEGRIFKNKFFHV